jgi:hypothetical protein
MTMTGKKPPTRRKLVSQKVGPVDKRRRPRGLTKAIRVAIDCIIHDRRTRAQACEKAGISERALYLALQKVEVAAHWNAQIDVLRSAERPHNVFALVDVRDNSGNAMARVQAARSLETLADEAAARPGGPGRQTLPGLIVMINNVPVPPTVQPQTIEHDPQPPRPLSPAPFDVRPAPPKLSFKPEREQ